MRRSIQLSPTQILVLGYIIVITIGTFLLLLPMATVSGERTTVLDALFTATSATAVTGLVVENTATHWTQFGQIVIMLLIQIGGFGFMTTSTLVMILLGKRISLRERLVILEEKNMSSLSGLIRLIRYVVLLTVAIEGTGALLLFIRFLPLMPPGRALYFGVFHSVSAFNNAGFDLFGNSLEDFTGDWYLTLVIAGLLIVGGLGFTVLSEMYKYRKFKRFSLHTKMVLIITLLLLAVGTIGILLFEYANPSTLGGQDWSGKLAGAFFQGTVPRTAGFNSVPMGKLSQASLFLMIILMFIGASPGSTGGGVKTTTFGTLLAVLWSMIRNREDVVVFERRLSYVTIFKALSVVMISLLLVTGVTMVLTLTEALPFLQLLFETVSAFATVGLSTGITTELSTIGKILIIMTMFIGRVGPMTLAIALGEQRRQASIRYPEERLMIG